MRCVCRRPIEIEQTEIVEVEIQQQDKEEFESLTCKDALSSSTPSSCYAPVVPLRKEPFCQRHLELRELQTRLMRTTGRSSLVRGITQRQRDTEAFKHEPGSLGTVCIDEMDSVLGIFQEEHEAVNSFFPDRAVRSYNILHYSLELTCC